MAWYCADRACGATRDDLAEYLSLRAHLWDKGTDAAASIHDERVELAEAGLPTTFGCAKQGRRRRRPAGKAQAPVPRAVVDDIVEAEYAEDGCRYPARVLTVRRTQRASVRVRFLGYGNEAWVSRVWPLTNELFDIWADWIRADERSAATQELARLRSYAQPAADAPTADSAALSVAEASDGSGAAGCDASGAGAAGGNASAAVAGSLSLARYWDQRYRYFSRFDEGVAMDEEGCALRSGACAPPCMPVHASVCASVCVCSCVCGLDRFDT